MLNMLGPVKVYIKDAPATTPCPSGTTPNWTGWTQMGWKSEKGVSWKVKSKVDDVTVEEFNAPVDAVLTEESFTVSVALKKSDVTDMKYAMVGVTVTPSGNYTNKVTGGGGSISYLSLGLEGVSPAGKKLVLWVPKCTAADGFDVTFKKGDGEIPFEFKSYCDTTQPTGAQLWSLYEMQ